MAVYEYQSCCDFSTSTGLSHVGDLTEAAWSEADRRNLTSSCARRFTQGFIHAVQGRNDLHGDDCDYDAGFAAGIAWRP